MTGGDLAVQDPQEFKLAEALRDWSISRGYSLGAQDAVIRAGLEARRRGASFGEAIEQAKAVLGPKPPASSGGSARPTFQGRSRSS